MKGLALSECAGTPPFHSGCQHGNDIDAALSQRNVAANLLEAFASKQLAGTRDMVEAAEPEIVRRAFFLERCAGDAELRVLVKLLEKKLEVVRSKREVGVKTS